MIRIATLLATVGLLLALAPSIAGAEDAALYQARITAELADQDIEAARLFAQANTARGDEQWQQAADLYSEVLALQPGFFHAARRRCGVLSAMGQRSEALIACRLALKAAPEDVFNMAMTAQVLATGLGDAPAPAEEMAEAQRLAVRAWIKAPDEPSVAFARCEVAWMKEDVSGMGGCSRALQRLAPEDPATWWFSFIVAGSEGDLAEASYAIDRAEAVGLPAEVIDQMRDAVAESRSPVGRVWAIGKWVLLGWGAVALLLLVLGFLLSSMAMSASRKLPTVQTGEAVGLDGSLRKAYRAVLLGSCIFYYVSMPLVLLSVVAAGGSIIWLFFAVGRIPIKLVAIVGIVVLVTLWAGLKSFLVRSVDTDPGEKMVPADHPRLHHLLKEVASKVGTRPVDTVFITPGTDVAVFERGGMLAQLRGNAERCLILGVGVLEGMKLVELRSILAHEYGHFSNRDTAGGGFALAVRRSVQQMAIGLVQGGAAGWFNPAWLFLRGFNAIFLRISQGASRLQEVLADRWAAFTYGSAAFDSGFRHVIEQSVRFDAHVSATLREVVDRQGTLANLYGYQPDAPVPDDQVAEAVQAVIDREPSPFDSHPAPRDRLAWVGALGARGKPQPDDQAECWSLFEDRQALEARMTDQIRGAVAANHGVVIRAS